ncbi:hypothetical protein MA16_Dca013521 [Dendrobium catenatum]|uniref:RNase H type-1 domain-containing protein n=1 Tax=Dendrobium catenatum TaxID=906689 RepID=A0A2I0W490_9ASPA|nr:hypothetical protein MA16_Dca013521 [Dendrobium catenatum]
MPVEETVATDGRRRSIVDWSSDYSVNSNSNKFHPLKIYEPTSVSVNVSTPVSGKGKQILKEDLFPSSLKDKIVKDDSSTSGGIGGVIRDNKGRFLCTYGSSCLHWYISQLELYSILSLKNFLQRWILEAKIIIIEGDNYNVINFIRNLVNKGDFKVDLGKGIDFSFLKEFNQILFHCVNRNGNKLADSIPHFISLLKDESDSIAIT